MDKVRVDKWLWSVRIFKSRTISSEACKSNKVKLNGVPLKPSYLISRGDHLMVNKNGFSFEYMVVDLIAKRVSATLAAPCYEDITPESELNKYENWFVGKSKGEFREKGLGRPTKRERRDIEGYKDVRFEEE